MKDKHEPPANGSAALLRLLDVVRTVAQSGLNFTDSSYDRDRYQHLFDLAVDEYARLADLPPHEIGARFQRELGYMTPKVGTAAALFDPDGRLLLVRNADDGGWGLPAGFAEVNLTPEDNLRREVREEAGVEIGIRRLITVFAVLPGQYGAAHTLYTLLYHCAVVDGTPTASYETPAVGYFDHRQVQTWSHEHGQLAELAYRYWLENRDSKENQ